MNASCYSNLKVGQCLSVDLVIDGALVLTAHDLSNAMGPPIF